MNYIDKQVTKTSVCALNINEKHTFLVTYKGMTFVCNFTDINTSQKAGTGKTVRLVATVTGYGE